MPREIGMVYSWKGGYINVAITDEKYRPGTGDIYYVKLPGNYILLQAIGFEGELPVSVPSIISAPGETPPLYSLQKVRIARSTLFFEIKHPDKNPLVIRPNQPPPLESPVYVLSPGDEESERIMKILSEGISPDRNTIPIAWLRSGIASAQELRREKYFPSATLNLDLKKAVPKHFLVAGQTGAGKTTCVMGLIVQWARCSEDKIGWLIIDRHGEYSVATHNGFIDVLDKALKLNDKLEARAKIYQLSTNTSNRPEQVLSRTTLITGSIDVSSINLYDIGNALDMSLERISELEETIDILAAMVRAADKLPEEWKSVFVDMETGRPTGQLLALLPLLVDNVFRYEGIGERNKRGIYRVLLNTGIDIKKLRIYRRQILSVLGLSKRNEEIKYKDSSKVIVVLDDSRSVFKVSPILKDPAALVKLFKALIDSANKQYNVDTMSPYPWRYIDVQPTINRLREGDISIDNIIDDADNGEIIVLDVSKIPLRQGDVIIMSVIRRLFDLRMGMGVDVISGKPPIAIVSEEAPLYLSPDKIKSPYNVFARVAREGRKFGLGLVAITQLATQIERQLLANFNTIISLRTKYVTDINYFSSIGIPGETLTYLGDREGYLYTPDLRIKEPIPVYFPGYFEYSEEIADELKKRGEKQEEITDKALDEIFSDEGEGEDI